MSEEGALFLAGISSVFILKLVCFLLGYLIVRTGAALLREGVKGEFKFKSELHGAKADLASASPGLLFLLLGVVLIGYAMWIPKSSSLEVDRPKFEEPAPDVSIPPADDT